MNFLQRILRFAISGSRIVIFRIYHGLTYLEFVHILLIFICWESIIFTQFSDFCKRHGGIIRMLNVQFVFSLFLSPEFSFHIFCFLLITNFSCIVCPTLKVPLELTCRQLQSCVEGFPLEPRRMRYRLCSGISGLLLGSFLYTCICRVTNPAPRISS